MAQPKAKAAPIEWNRKATPSEDPTKLLKLGRMYKEAMTLEIYKEPRPLKPHALGVSILNRQFSVQQCHTVIIPSIEKHSHVDDRTPFGICVWIRDPEKLKRLIDHNVKLSAGSRLMPTVHTDVMTYECLDCSHYNVVLRIGDEGGALSRR